MEFRLVQEICRENSVKLIGIDDPSLLEDKFKYLGLLHDAGVAIPKMASCIENIDWNAKLYIKKPRLGFGSIGTQVGKVSELNDTSDCFIQEYLDGKEVTVDCFYDSNTQFVYSVTRDRIETKLGVTTKSKVYFDQQLHQVCSGIMKALKLDGGACIQFINSSNRWRVIDVNPRLGAGSKISTRCGADFFSATIAYNLGLSYHKYFNRTAQQANYVVRQYQEIITQ
jgi:predicted ATP-grasp superfamily ATP-dependent carboligase